MILNLCRILADWCADPTNGVNARIAGVELDGADLAPPALAAVYDPTRSGSGWVAALQVPQEIAFPALLVLPYQDGLFEEGIAVELFRGRDLPFALIDISDGHDAGLALQQSLYRMRATQRAINALLDHTVAAVAARTRNNVRIETIEAFSTPRPMAPLDGTTVSVAAFVSFQAADLTPKA